MSDPLDRLLPIYPAQARPIGRPRLLGNAGGGSGARLWRFDSGLGPLVARAWPPDGPGRTSLARMHGWIARLADLDFVPVPLATLDGRTLVPIDDRLWEVAPWRPGVADLARPPGRARLRAGFSGLAAVHARLAPEAVTAPSPGLIARLAEAEDLLDSGLARLESALRVAPDDPARDLARRWIAQAWDGLPALVARLRREAQFVVPVFPVLRDARPDHFLFEGDQLTGLVDFGAMDVDSPSTDLARLLSEWVGPDRPARAEALDAYAAVRPPSSVEIARIDAFAESAAWLGPARWARWQFLDRRAFDDSDAVRLGLERGLNRLRERITS